MLRLALSAPVLIALAVTTGCGCRHGHYAHPYAAPGVPEGLRVSGQGEVRAAPDVARATLGVEVRAATPEEATRLLGERMASVIAALKSQGVAENDLQTAQLTLYFERTDRPEPPPPTPGKEEAEARPTTTPPAGFHRATNTVRVTIRDLARATQVISAATAAGANAVRGIQFELEDQSVAVAEARALAMKDAQKNASQLAELAGVELGPVIAITEGASYPMPQIAPMAMRAEAAGAMQVEKGEMTITHQVELVYSLKTDEP